MVISKFWVSQEITAVQKASGNNGINYSGNSLETLPKAISYSSNHGMKHFFI